MDLTQARFNMVEQQVRTWEVLDQAVLDAMMDVPRDRFVPEPYRLLAYSDIRIPLPCGQAMFAPKWEGRLLQALKPTRECRALEIGTGSGYLAALLGRLCGEVVSVEIHAELSAQAARRLRVAAADNVLLEVGDGIEGWPSRGPYDLVAVTASSPARRPALEQQLTEGGRMFIVCGVSPAMEATLVTRLDAHTWTSESLFELELEPLIGAETRPQFEF